MVSAHNASNCESDSGRKVASEAMTMTLSNMVSNSVSNLAL